MHRSVHGSDRDHLRHLHFDQWGIVGGHTSAYRWHIQDPLVFNTGIKVTLEHFGWIAPDENPDYKSMSWNEREDDYTSVAFWYQTGTPTFTERAPAGPERRSSSSRTTSRWSPRPATGWR